MFPESLVLRDGELVLRGWQEDDAPALETVCGDPAVCHFTSVPWTFTSSSSRRWVQSLHDRRSAGTTLALAITRAAEGVALGTVSLSHFSADGGEAELGYWLVPAARGQGLAVKAAKIMSTWAFDELALVRMELMILPENFASHRVAERLGAVREELRPNSHEADGRFWDMVVYSLSAPPRW